LIFAFSIAESTAGISMVVCERLDVHDGAQSKVDEGEMLSSINHDVLQLDISVRDSNRMGIFYCAQ
jgi:hypothetical protein